jgi:hypothetical protein
MRFLVEIFIVTGLIYLGWEKPFKEWAGQNPTPPPLAAAPSPTLPVKPLPSPAAWMTDPNHRGALDRPVPASTAAQQPVSGSWRLDPTHHSPLDPPDHGSPTPH